MKSEIPENTQEITEPTLLPPLGRRKVLGILASSLLLPGILLGCGEEKKPDPIITSPPLASNAFQFPWIELWASI